jgi:8-amino-7-oxononanoate synthase
MSAHQDMQRLLQSRREKGNFRSLSLVSEGKIDFCSNDYLGFSSEGKIEQLISAQSKNSSSIKSGSGGSRLLAGNSLQAEQLEKRIATFHGGESALLFNSGYDANLGFYSCVPQKNDLIIYDEHVHASILDGIRFSLADSIKFRHNQLEDLLVKYARKSGKYNSVFVVVESVYSMNGDMAPLEAFANLCFERDWNLCVDEAHAGGVFGEQGRGLVNEMGLENRCFARLYAYGKAFGANGAAVVGSDLLREYLVNFSRPFIYSTALPPQSLQRINAAYDLLSREDNREKLRSNIRHAKEIFSEVPGYVSGDSPIQILRIPGNHQVAHVAQSLQQKGFDVRAIKSPTVPVGNECIRICLHAFNTNNEIEKLKFELMKVISINQN